MGREIRRVPPNWQHPKSEDPHRLARGDQYQPIHDQSYQEAAAEWKAEFLKWEAGERPDYFQHDKERPNDYQFWEYNGDPPDRKYYRPHWAESEATWFQMYETVSEGTPVTPPFATREELIDYLVKNGDFWDQRRGQEGWAREDAEAFVNVGWAPSLLVASGKMMTARDSAEMFKEGSQGSQ